MADTNAGASERAFVLDCWECITKKRHLTRQHLDCLNLLGKVSGDDVLLKLSAITQLFKSETSGEDCRIGSSSCHYVAVNVPLLECLYRCISSNSKLVAFSACKAFVAVVTSNVLADSARRQWIDGLCQKIIESAALSQSSSSFGCNATVYGLEALRLSIKHWRVAMAKWENCLPIQASLIAECIQSHLLTLIEVVFKLQSSSMHCLHLTICDAVGTFLAFHRETLLFTGSCSLNNTTTLPSMSSTDVLLHLRQTSMTLIPKWISLLDNSSYPSRIKRQILDLVSCSLPTPQLCSPNLISAPVADIVTCCLQSVNCSEFCSSAVQQLTLPLACGNLSLSPLVVNAVRPKDESLSIQSCVLVSLKLAVGFLKCIQTDAIGDDSWRCLNDCILNPVAHSTIDSLGFTEILFSLFGFQDDHLIDVLWLYMEGCNQLKQLTRMWNDLLPVVLDRIPSSHHLFGRLLKFVGLDHSVLLDFLISSETRFLDYFTSYLKMVIRNWDDFRSANRKLVILTENRGVDRDIGVGNFDSVATGDDVDSVMTVLIRLRLAVERLQCQDLFPYNATPLLALLEQVEECYENDATEL